MIGIGGASMSGISEILKNWGFHIAGSDIYRTEITEKLVNSGIPVTIGHDPDNIKNFDLVVYSAAISRKKRFPWSYYKSF